MFTNKSKAIQKYSQTEKSSNLAKNSIEIVEIILKELERSMKIVSDLSEKYKIDENERKKRNSHFSRACTAIYSLQTSLDFEKGGEIATNLESLYAFCQKNMLQAVGKSSPENLNVVSDIVKDISSAWDEIKPIRR